MPRARLPVNLSHIAANTAQLLSVTAVTVLAGLSMVLTGTKKKLLRWKDTHHRCPTCGRTDRHNCACSR